MRSRHVPTVPQRSPTPNAPSNARSAPPPQRAAKRARIVLLAADGVPNRRIAPMVGMNEHTVAQWRRQHETNA